MLVDGSGFQDVSLGRVICNIFTPTGPLVYRWEANDAAHGQRGVFRSPCQIRSIKVAPIAAALALSAFMSAVAASPDSAQSYNPTIDPANFSIEVNNPYFKLTPGTTCTYKSKEDEGAEINKVTVTDKTKKVMGVATRVVWDRVWFNDQLIEETYDWYAQDKD
jgi:hypothetical protein